MKKLVPAIGAALILSACGGGGDDVNKNAPPVANAGSGQSVMAGELVPLSGAQSTDADNDSLKYKWQFESIPSGSGAKIERADTVTPSFVADIPGRYVVTLIVNDGKTDSSPSTVIISASSSNAAPVANAGVDQNILVGKMISLNGLGSSDANGDALSYAWTLTSKPTGSTSTLSAPDTAQPGFTADIPGAYVFSLIVNDGHVDSEAATVTVTATASSSNAAPVANAGDNQSVLAGALVNLNGAASSDADGDQLTYLWTLTSKPAGSSAALSAANVAQPSFTADLAGSYVATLVVNDGKEDSKPVATTVVANALPIAVSSTSYADGGVMPLKYASTYKGGNNVSPAISIANVPVGTKYLAIVMDDEVAPCGTGVNACIHWGVFNLPATKTSIAENENLSTIPGVVFGKTYDGTFAYAGPNPPNNHVYNLTVYALDATASVVPSGVEWTRANFEMNYAGKILGKATYAGRYPN